jgi:hypothetical protein
VREDTRNEKSILLKQKLGIIGYVSYKTQTKRSNIKISVEKKENKTEQMLKNTIEENFLKIKEPLSLHIEMLSTQHRTLLLKYHIVPAKKIQNTQHRYILIKLLYYYWKEINLG